MEKKTWTESDGAVSIGEIKESQFSVNFRWENIGMNIRLANGEDVFRLGEIYKKMLDENNISYIEEHI